MVHVACHCQLLLWDCSFPGLGEVVFTNCYLEQKRLSQMWSKGPYILNCNSCQKTNMSQTEELDCNGLCPSMSMWCHSQPMTGQGHVILVSAFCTYSYFFLGGGTFIQLGSLLGQGLGPELDNYLLPWYPRQVWAGSEPHLPTCSAPRWPRIWRPPVCPHTSAWTRGQQWTPPRGTC